MNRRGPRQCVCWAVTAANALRDTALIALDAYSFDLTALDEVEQWQDHEPTEKIDLSLRW